MPARAPSGFTRPAFRCHRLAKRMRLAKRWQRNAGRVKPDGALAGIAAAGLVVGSGESANCSAAQKPLQVEHPVEVGLANLADQPDEAAKRAVAMKNMGVINGAAGLHEGGEHLSRHPVDPCVINPASKGFRELQPVNNVPKRRGFND